MTIKTNYLIPIKLVWALILLLAVGCQSQPDSFYDQELTTEPRTIAIAPFLNLSGSEHLDSMAVTDAFYLELQQVNGLAVVDNNIMLSLMMEMGMDSVTSPQDALVLADQLQADAIIVGAVTSYDPYPPPEVGMTVHLYVRETPLDDNANEDVNPGRYIRQPAPIELRPSPQLEPRVGLTRIIDADRQDVVEKIKQYASIRTGQLRPHSWRYYTTQTNYLRFVSYEIIGDLLARERDWLRVNH